MSSPKTILITGANTGLGLAIVKSLAASSQPYTILVGSRSLSNAEKAISETQTEHPNGKSTFHPIQVDLADDSSLEAAIQKVSTEHDGKLDVLLNNGGANFDTSIGDGSQPGRNLSVRDAFNKSWDTNVTGTHVLTGLAIPLLLKSADPRLIFMTSGTSSLAETERQDNAMFQRINAAPAGGKKGWPKDLGINPITGYRSVKTGLNMLMREWVRLLKADGVKVWCISPGMLATGLAGVGVEQLKKMGAQDPSVGANFTRDVVEGKRDGDVGRIIRIDSIQAW